MKTESKRSFWLFTGLTAVTALFLYHRAPFLYAVNDDLFMKNIVSGAYLGVPDAHTVYLEYPLSLFLSGLYRMWPGIPWYGIVFFLFHTVSWGAVCARSLCAMGKNPSETWRTGIKRPAAAVFMLFLYLAAGFSHIALLQFTTTAAVLGAAAVVWFMTADASSGTKSFLKDQTVTALFVFLSFNVRRNVLLMFVPVAGMLWLGRLLTENGKDAGVKRRGQAAGYVLTALLCAAGIVVSLAAYRIGYGSREWRNYIRYNDNATVLYDYSGWPDYEENRELYEELGITYESWYGAKTAYFLSVDNGIDAEAMERLAGRSETLRTAERSLFQSLADAAQVCIRRMYDETDRPLNLLVLGMYAAVLGGLILGRNQKAALRLGFFFAGRMFSWMYVALAGRYPVRITQSLLLMECTALLAFLMKDALPGYEELWKKQETGLSGETGTFSFVRNKAVNRLCKLSALAGAAGFLILMAYFGAARIRYVSSETARRLEESRDLEDLKEYCNARPDRFYMVDTKSITNDTERIFDGAQSAYENYIVFGGWLSESPVYQDKLKTAGVESAEEALLYSGRVYVIAENEERCPTDYIISYFESRYRNFRMEETDRFGRGGGQFSVYRLSADS